MSVQTGKFEYQPPKEAPENPPVSTKPNPKDAFGALKVPSYSVVPVTSMIYEALGMWDGGIKYGPFNWRENAVVATIYLDAARRHLDAWSAGQEIDPKSGMPHLGHAKACLGILVDAFETGNLIDDRPKNEATVRLLEQYDRTPMPKPSPMKDVPVPEIPLCEGPKWNDLKESEPELIREAERMILGSPEPGTTGYAITENGFTFVYIEADGSVRNATPAEVESYKKEWYQPHNVWPQWCSICDGFCEYAKGVAAKQL